MKPGPAQAIRNMASGFGWKTVRTGPLLSITRKGDHEIHQVHVTLSVTGQVAHAHYGPVRHAHQLSGLDDVLAHLINHGEKR